jgi:hypothetical protein
VTDLLHHANSGAVTPADARALAIDANRPDRPHPADIDPDPDQDAAWVLDPAGVQGYPAFDPTDVEWRL